MPGTALAYSLSPKTTMNGSHYLNLLYEKLKFHIDVHRCLDFMHDEAPLHKSRRIKYNLMAEKIQVRYWLDFILPFFFHTNSINSRLNFSFNV